MCTLYAVQGKEGSCLDGAVPRHSIELAMDIIAYISTYFC